MVRSLGGSIVRLPFFWHSLSTLVTRKLASKFSSPDKPQQKAAQKILYLSTLECIIKNECIYLISLIQLKHLLLCFHSIQFFSTLSSAAQPLWKTHYQKRPQDGTLRYTRCQLIWKLIALQFDCDFYLSRFYAQELVLLKRNPFNWLRSISVAFFAAPRTRPSLQTYSILGSWVITSKYWSVWIFIALKWKLDRVFHCLQLWCNFFQEK